MSATNLSDWLKGNFDDEWQPVSQLGINPSEEPYQLRAGRIIDLGVNIGQQNANLEVKAKEGKILATIDCPQIQVKTELVGERQYSVTLTAGDIDHKILFELI